LLKGYVQNKDTLKDLRASLHYYEHVADAKEDDERQDAIARTTKKLKNILTIMVEKLEGQCTHIIITCELLSSTPEIDQKIGTLQAELAGLFDCPELHNYRVSHIATMITISPAYLVFQYDLRAVLAHTGLPGRKQIYSYVRDQHDVWWKTVDYTVTEVRPLLNVRFYHLFNRSYQVPEETVLSDPTGLHLGAGPYFLVYSRYLSEEEINRPLVWPKVFKVGFYSECILRNVTYLFASR
jgi:hypothetical protein